jgi:hypothetical protein
MRMGSHALIFPRLSPGNSLLLWRWNSLVFFTRPYDLSSEDKRMISVARVRGADMRAVVLQGWWKLDQISAIWGRLAFAELFPTSTQFLLAPSRQKRS